MFIIDFYFTSQLQPEQSQETPDNGNAEEREQRDGSAADSLQCLHNVAVG